MTLKTGLSVVQGH